MKRIALFGALGLMLATGTTFAEDKPAMQLTVPQPDGSVVTLNCTPGFGPPFAAMSDLVTNGGQWATITVITSSGGGPANATTTQNFSCV